MAGGTSGCAFSANASTNFTTTFLWNQTPPSTSHHPLHSLFLSNSSSATFRGSRSMVSFEDVRGGKGCNGFFLGPYDHDENGDELDKEEYFHQPEKKRRLSGEQLRLLEKSFEEENKLEHQRKIQLARELGLQPRQVAIWFQNRRARWKTKQLEMDYDTVQASYNNLKANYDNLFRETDKLKAEVASLTEKLLGREKQEGNSKHAETNRLLGPLQKPLIDSASEGEGSKVSNGAFKQEDINSSAKSDIVDSDSPHHTDGVHSALPETGDSSNVFEPDQSDLSQDEEDNLSKTLLPQYTFPKLEDVDYTDPPHGSCNIGFPEEDHAFWSWSY